MSLEQQVRSTLKDAGSRIDTTSDPTRQPFKTGSRGRSQPLKPTMAFLVAFAAVLVLFGAVAVLVSGEREDPASGDQAPFSGPLRSIVGALPDGFDPENAPPLLTVEGSPEEVAAQYLESRIPTIGAGVARVEEEAGYSLVRWAWGSLLDPDDPRWTETGEAGWLLLRPASRGFEVVAATTDGVDLSGLTLSDGVVRGVVESESGQFIGADVLGLDGSPVDSAPHPDGFNPDADFLWGTGGASSPPLVLDIPVSEPVIIRVNRVGGTLLSISEVILGYEVATEDDAQVAGPRVDQAAMARARWVTHGPDGLRTDDGTLLWETEGILGETFVARDGAGGLAYMDGQGLWWITAGAETPQLVAGKEVLLPDSRLVEVIPTSSGPVARVGFPDSRYVDLPTGEPLADGPPGRVRADGSWVAANGLGVRVTGPDVTWETEGGVEEVLEPAHLVVERGDEVLADVVVGTAREPFAMIHDFDGRTVIVSRYPHEPALPAVDFFIIDLECADCVATFKAGATSVALVHPDTEWSGPVEAPDGIGLSGSDLLLGDAFVEFAKNPSTATFSSLPLADSVALGLGPRIVHSVDGESLQDPEAWVIDVAEFRAYTGPFSSLLALQSLDDYVVQVGEHSHCAGPPQPPADGLEGLRRVSVQPSSESLDSCLMWTTVDFFVGPSGQVEAITMDLWEP